MKPERLYIEHTAGGLQLVAVWPASETEGAYETVIGECPAHMEERLRVALDCEGWVN